MLFSSGQEATPIPVYPDLARIFSNFIGPYDTPDTVTFGQPQALSDSLLALTVFSIEDPIGNPVDEKEFREFVLALTACTARQSYGTIRRIPATIVHSHPSQITRFKLIRHVLEDSKLHAIKDSGIGWLKDELLSAANQAGGTTSATSSSSKSDDDNIFLNPHYFSVLFPSLFNPEDVTLNLTSDIAASWIRFSQILTPSIHSALNLYYILLSSPVFREKLQLQKAYLYFRTKFLDPLKSVCHAFESDMKQNGGEGRIEDAVGEEMCQIGMIRSVGVIGDVLERVEDVVGDAFVVPEGELEGWDVGDREVVEGIKEGTRIDV